MTPFFAFLLGGIVVAAVAVIRRRFASFGAQTPDDLGDSGPTFDLKSHLSGPILCEGLIFGPTGRVASRFVADMHGRWEGDTGTLQEVFRYDSGTIQQRCWNLALRADGHIDATAADVVGLGTGQAKGAAVVLRYRIRLTREAGGHVLDVVDWMYLMDNGTIMNRSRFSKFGVTVAELVATMRRVPA